MDEHFGDLFARYEGLVPHRLLATTQLRAAGTISPLVGPQIMVS